MSDTISVKLNNLDSCPSCQAGIQNDICKISHVKETDINPISCQVSVHFDVESESEKSKVIKSITDTLKPYSIIEVKYNGQYLAIEQQSNTKDLSSMRAFTLNNEMKIKIVRFVIGLCVFTMALYLPFTSTLQLMLFIGAYLLFGYDVIFDASKNIIKGKVFDENFLMTVSTLGAFAIKEYPEAVAVMLFFQIGELLQDMAVEKSRKNIKDLINIKVDTANVIVDGVITTVDPSVVIIGDIIIVKPGEKIPLDGRIVEGKTLIDSSSLIGESVPRSVQVGHTVLSGSLNVEGVVKIEVTKDYKNSTVVKIMEMVEHASSKKAPTEKFLTKFCRYYTPVVVLSALALAFIPPLFTSTPDLSLWISKSLVFLVASCPCALVVSVPLTFFSGVGAASKKGILVKGSNYLQLLSQANTVVFDKTGTLTKGVFMVTQVSPSDGVTEKELLEKACFVESFSNHPIAKSIVEYSKEKGVRQLSESALDFKEMGGKGICAVLSGKNILAGNARLLKEKNIEVPLYSGLGAVVYVAEDNKYLGCIVISDILKDDARLAIENIKNQGIENIVMLTGDREEAANKVASTIGIKKVFAELLPHQKVEKIEDIYEKYKNATVIFAGDGINDAPVLARCDIGIAMGGIGSDAAIEAADVVIMDDSPSKIPVAIKISKNTIKIVKQNVAFALIIKFLVLFLAVLGYANIWMAVFADVGVTLLVVLNAMRKK